MSSNTNDSITCAICRHQNSFGGVGHWAWHRFCRAELNPVALIARIEQQRLGEVGDAIVSYIIAVTGMDIKAARAALAEEGTASDARLTSEAEGKAIGSATEDLSSRLCSQAMSIAKLLRKAGVGPCGLDEGVRLLINAKEVAEAERDALQVRLDAAERANQKLADAAEMLWVVLANVSGGNWGEQSAEWQEAAARCRDDYFAAVSVTKGRG